ncbi:hypothetical protein EG329_014044 [Mollisiaceae sp. DMI_Dod_QoI]|nr:hypothetical protein EG329_014044 [Helotiales sp. DMI_Dod_QoI]
MKVIVEPHNPGWHFQFIRVRNSLRSILEGIPVLSIEHVGSTSIPDLPAKPLLDIDIVVKAESLIPTSEALVAAGYENRGDKGVPGRVIFRQPGLVRRDKGIGSMEDDDDLDIIRNTNVILEGSLALKNHRDLKRMMLEDADLRKEYGEVKKRLVENGIVDMVEYCRGKNEIILKILREAGWAEDDLEEVRKSNE